VVAQLTVNTRGSHIGTALTGNVLRGMLLVGRLGHLTPNIPTDGGFFYADN
jgi:hypothetical protein